MTYTFTFNPHYEWEAYPSKFVSLVLKHVDDPRILYEGKHFRSESNDARGLCYDRIHPTFTQFLNGDYHDVIYQTFTVELNLNEKEEELFKKLQNELLIKKQTELLTQVLNQFQKGKTDVQ